jgi:hypothetical protein
MGSGVPLCMELASTGGTTASHRCGSSTGSDLASQTPGPRPTSVHIFGGDAWAASSVRLAHSPDSAARRWCRRPCRWRAGQRRRSRLLADGVAGVVGPVAPGLLCAVEPLEMPPCQRAHRVGGTLADSELGPRFLGGPPARRWSPSQPDDQVADLGGLGEEWVMAGIEFHDAGCSTGELALSVGRGALVLRADEVRRGHVLPGR